MGQQIYRFRKASSLATLALLVAALAIAGSLFAAPPDAAGQSSQSSPCRKEINTAYHGGKGMPYFTGIPNAESYEPATEVDGKDTVVRNLLAVDNASETASCDWRVTSKSVDWVTLDSESGSLSPGNDQLIRVSINSNARSLNPGKYKARIQFQLGPAADKWNGYAWVTLEILDECYIKVKDAERLDIREGGRAVSWEGTMGRTQSDSLVHRIVVWNSSNSRCRLSADVTTPSSRRWLDAEFEGEGETVIGKGDTANLILSANERWNNLNPGKHRASITIRDAISGAERHLYAELTAENEPCQLANASETSLRFEAVARSVKSQAIPIALENRGVEACDWQVKGSPNWLEVDPSEGEVWGDGGRKSVDIKIKAADANGLPSSPGEGQPHTDSIVFSYLVRGIPKSLTVPVDLHLAKPPCDLQTHTPEDMLISYTPGETINSELHHLTIEASNAPDSQECHYNLELPDWLESDDSEGVIPEGESREITVKLKADTPEAQAAKQTYRSDITFAVAGASDTEVPVTLETGCPVQEACAYLHTTHTEIHVGDSAKMTYAVSSPLNTDVIVRLTLELPSGWSMDGEGFADKCSGICTANHEVLAGDQKSIEIVAYPNHPGQFVLTGRAEYNRRENGRFVPYAHSQDAVTITVQERESMPAPQPAPNTPAPTRTPTPTATPIPTPTATPVPPVAAVLPPQAPSAPLSTPNNGQDWSRTDWLLAGVIGSGVLVFIALVIIVGIVLYLFLRPRRQRPAVPPTSQRRPPPGQWSARPAAPNQRR